MPLPGAHCTPGTPLHVAAGHGMHPEAEDKTKEGAKLENWR